MGAEAFAREAAALCAELQPAYDLLRDMQQLRDAALLLFCSLEHRAVGLLDSASLQSAGWLQLLANVVKVHLLGRELPAKQIVQVYTLACCLVEVRSNLQSTQHVTYGCSARVHAGPGAAPAGADQGLCRHAG